MIDTVNVSSPTRLAITLCLVCAGLIPAQMSGGAGARVVTLTGTLTVKPARQPAHSLKINDPVQIGDELITGENSEAVIRTSDGATVRLFPDSRVIFSERSFDIQEFLHLFLGSIKVHIEKFSGRPNPHKLTTPTAVIAVRGTTFSVFVDDTDATLVAVDEGVVSVANVRSPSEELILQRGQRTWVRPGQPPMQAQRFRGRSERADMIPPQGTGGEMGNHEGSMAGSHMGQGAGMARAIGGMQGHAGPPH